MTKIAEVTARFCCKTFLAASVLLASAQCLQTASPNGQAIYQSHCAMCHETANTPPFMNHHVLKSMAPENIVSALTSGPMRSQGASLKPAERVAVAEFLTGQRIRQFPPADAKHRVITAADHF